MESLLYESGDGSALAGTTIWQRVALAERLSFRTLISSDATSGWSIRKRCFRQRRKRLSHGLGRSSALAGDR
jgi:hypothetical protein